MVKAQDGPYVVVDFFFVVGRHEESHRRPGGAGRRLDHVGHVAVAGVGVVVLQFRSRALGVASEVEVGAVGDALQLVPPPREQELHVGGVRRVVAQLVAVVFPEAQEVLGHAQVPVPAHPGVAPVAVPLGRVVGRHEELHLHLFEFAGPEHEVAGGDLVAKGLSDLGDAEWRLLARRVHHVGEVDEHALGCFRAQIHLGRRFDHWTGVGLEHEVELAGLGQRAGPAARWAGFRILELVLAVPGPALPAVHEWVGEVGQVAGSLPDGGRREDRGVETDHVVA